MTGTVKAGKAGLFLGVLALALAVASGGCDHGGAQDKEQQQHALPEEAANPDVSETNSQIPDEQRVRREIEKIKEMIKARQLAGVTSRGPGGEPKPNNAVEVLWSGGKPTLQFRPLWRTIEKVQSIRIGSEPDDLSRTIDIVGRDEQRVDPNFLRNAKPNNFNSVAIPWDKEKLYIQLTYADGTKSEVETVVLKNANPAPMVWLKAKAAAEGIPPRVLATWSGNELGLLPFAPNGTRKILAGFKGQSLKPIEMDRFRIQAGSAIPMDEVASWEKDSDLRLLFQLKDGSEIGPFAYDLSPIEDMIRENAAKRARLDRRAMLKCERREKDPFEPSVRCFADPKTDEIRDQWLGVKEVRVGASPDNLSKTLAVNVPIEAFISRHPYRNKQQPDGFVRVPGDTQEVYAKFILYDGTELDPIRLEPGSAGP